jgi:hypothetical protein
MFPPCDQEVGCGTGDGAAASVGVGVAVAGLGDGVAVRGTEVGIVGVAVGDARRSGLGIIISIVPQIMLTVTSALSIKNNFPAARPLTERFTSYLRNLLYSQLLSPCKAGSAYGSISRAISSQGRACSQSPR